MPFDLLNHILPQRNHSQRSHRSDPRRSRSFRGSSRRNWLYFVKTGSNHSVHHHRLLVSLNNDQLLESFVIDNIYKSIKIIKLNKI